MILEICAFIGRFIGLSISHEERIPLTFCPHVARYLMGQPPCLADLRAIDPELHSQLETLLQIKTTDPSSIAQMELSFVVGCPKGFGPTSMNLKKLPKSTQEHLLNLPINYQQNNEMDLEKIQQTSNTEDELMKRALYLSKIDSGIVSDTGTRHDVSEEEDNEGDTTMGGTSSNSSSSSNSSNSKSTTSSTNNRNGQEEDEDETMTFLEDDDVLVTADNVEEFVELYVAAILRWNVIDQLDAIREGMMEFIPPSAWHGGSPMDFNLLLGGTPTVSVDEIKARTDITSGDSSGASTQLISNWFWIIVGNMTQLQRSKLLYFSTGSTRLPSGTGKALTVEIVSSLPVDSLPMSTTCSKKLQIPAYMTMEQFRSKLLLAVENCNNYELQ